MNITQIRKEINKNPSEKQIEAGNYKKGHISLLGFKITIENPKGSYRKGKDSNGKKWKTLMKNDYGYFNRTVGKDGDAIDVFIGNNKKSTKIFAIDQKINNHFDETKIMLCFNNSKDAKNAYLANYDKSWNGFWHITEVNISDFKKWLYDGHKQKIPFFKYKEFKHNIINEQQIRNIIKEHLYKYLLY